MAGILIIALFSFALADEGSNSDKESNITAEKEDDDRDSNNELEKSDTEIKIKEQFKENEVEIEREIKSKAEGIEIKEKFRLKIKEKNGEFEVEGKKKIKIRELDDIGEKKEIIAGRINAKTGLNLTADDLGDGTRLRAILSNGKFAEIKIMPDKASEIALGILKAKCVERNCTVELKEVGDKLGYELETEKNVSIFFFFKSKVKVRAVVDAETGQIILIKRPWWKFLFKEVDEEENEDLESNIEADETADDKGKKVTLCHIPPGNPAGKNTIIVGESAVKAHLAHGDYLGACKISGNETGGSNGSGSGSGSSGTGSSGTGNSSQTNITVNLIEGVGVGSQG